MLKYIQTILATRWLMLALGVLVVAGGWFSYERLPVDALPDVTPALVQVFTLTEGLAPEEVEKFVTYPVESVMNGLPGVDHIRSVSNFGLSVVNIYFEDGTDLYFARQLVGERLGEAREQIPEGFGEPRMGPITTGMGQILFYRLEDATGRYSPTEMRTIQDWIVKYNLQTVKGVTEVLSLGGQVKQYQILIRPADLLRYGLTIHEVVESVEANNSNVGAQFIIKNSEQYIVRSVGLAEDLDDLESIVLKTVDGTPVYLRQVADVVIGGEPRQGLATADGRGEAVVGMVLKLIGTNTSEVIARVKARLDEINRILPAGVRIIAYYDQATLVENVVNTVTTALVQGIVLVVIILLAFMGGLRPSLVVALSIPFSILFAFMLMKLLGISANLMSLGGLAIAIGMMVDGTIVMVENVDRVLRESDPDESRLGVVTRACAEVGRPIFFAIGIIVLVFLPLFTLQGVEGKTFRPLAYTISLAMFGSLLFAMLLAPVFAYCFMRPPRRARRDHKPAGENWIVRLLLYPYRPVVGLFVRGRVLAVLLAVGIFALGLAIFPLLGSEFLPRLNEGDLLIRATMAPSISLEEAGRTITRFEQDLRARFPEVRQVVSRVGRGEVGAHADPVNNAEIFVELRPRAEWTSAATPEALMQMMSEAFEDYPGAQFNFTQPIAAAVDELLTGTKAELAIKLFGPDMEVLAAKADEIAAVIGEVPGAADVQKDQVTGTPQVRIRMRYDQLERYGLNVRDVQEVIRAAIGGAEAGQIFEGVRRFDITVWYHPEHRASIEAIRRILIPGPGDLRIPLEDVAHVEEIVGPRQITRENNQRFITVQTNVRGRDIGSFVEQGRAAIAARVDLPPGYLVTWGGQFELQQQANRRLAIVVPVTLLLVFLLLFSSFNSIRNALLILLNIPLALVGGVVGLWLAGLNLSVPASVGFIALFGIALENGMVLVTCLNQLVREGLPMAEACVRGACLRLRPVLMTAATTALGLIPLLFSSGTGSEVQRPLATVVIGGLVSSTILTLLVLPALYKWFSIPPQRG
ncbi:MAG TPA: CusA/CzcA family heavy metal efflux RND transporter [Candidatus Sumerlaeota bacterium]|nr:MAG: Cobalt-zinc-cadmium resistance protein CzcA [candidate division BRC1 bacterium ADurb.BinA292]HOE96590.1 CusA/CzcA family heavy metal efflux RND transporter [Candidatus Sumerlaeota bacterium]HOR26558.1 CusA/CzcA family heavy metal efflux RND transporter [Candidatus Sumerlaeota bacterium]HPK00879.1 CusA/CzcA family heavy metal efflux RND transporter [Candidatus Sumerlaeota bacterium]